MSIDLIKRTFTVEEYHRMGTSNIFDDERVELVEGEVVTMAPKGSRHSACVTRLTQLLVSRVEESFLVRVQEPLILSEMTEFEPDVATVRSRADFYSGAHPSAKDTLLVIEVAESSLTYDREIKLPLYARAGVPEAWLVDLKAQLVSVHSTPSAQGYELVEEMHPGEGVESASVTHLRLKIDEILG